MLSLMCDARYASIPFDNIKTRMQGSTNRYHGMLDCAKKSLANESVGVFLERDDAEVGEIDGRINLGSELEIKL